MEPLTDRQLLDETRRAIDAITSGRVSSYTLPNGQSVTKLDVPMLWQQVSRLERRIKSRSGRTIFRRANMRFD